MDAQYNSNSPPSASQSELHLAQERLLEGIHIDHAEEAKQDIIIPEHESYNPLPPPAPAAVAMVDLSDHVNAEEETKDREVPEIEGQILMNKLQNPSKSPRSTRRSTGANQRGEGLRKSSLSYKALEAEDLRKSLSKTSTTTSRIRKSVLMLETTKHDKYCAWMYYLVLTGVLAIFTSLSFFRTIGLAPTPPDTNEISTAIREYNGYIEAVSNEVGENMTVVYEQSLESQSAECIVLQNDATNEQDRVKNDSNIYAQEYCDMFILRLWDRAEELGVLNDSQTYPTCPSDIASRIDLFWVVGSENCTSATSSCLYGFIRQTIPTTCSDSFDFDGFSDPERAATNTRTCRSARSTMIDFANDYNEADTLNSVDFLESLDARLDYDYNYLLGFLPTVSTNLDLSTNADFSLDTITVQSLPEFQAQLDYQLQYMQNAFDIYTEITAITNPLGINIPNIEAPDLSVPTVSSIAIDDIDIAIDSIELDLALFEDYDPPVIVGFTFNDSADFTIDFDFIPSNISLAESSLVDEVQDVIVRVTGFVDNFANFDLAFRLCVWLHEVSVVLSSKRRDFSTVKSRIKRTIGAILFRSKLWLILGTLIWLSANVVSLVDFSFSDITAELDTNCVNEVVVSNSRDLFDFQEQLFSARTECDASIATLNNISERINDELVGGLFSLQDNYESYYQSNNLDRTSFLIDTIAITAEVELIEFSLEPDYTGITKAIFASSQSITDIERFTIDTALCESPEAEEVARQLAIASETIQNYITIVLVMTLLLNLVSRCFSFGLRNLFYMSLTKGYSFDEPFTGAELISRLKSRKTRAIIGFVLTLIFLIAVLVYASVST